MAELDYIKRQDVLRMLGISTPTLVRMQERGLPSYKVGHLRMYRKSEIEAFIRGNNPQYGLEHDNTHSVACDNTTVGEFAV